MRLTLRRLATHAPRVPSIKFLGRSRGNTPHPATAHPEAPQAIIDAFPSFLKKLSASTKLNAASSSAPSVKKPAPLLHSIDEVDLPLRMQRARYAPTLDEIEAVESGGASIAPLVTKASRKAWYTPAQF